MNSKYRILRTMAVVFKVMAWVSLVLGMIASVTFMIQFSLMSQQLGTNMPAFAGFSIFVIFVAYALLAFGSLFALSEMIRLLFDIERQTRAGDEKVVGMKRAA